MLIEKTLFYKMISGKKYINQKIINEIIIFVVSDQYIPSLMI